MLESISACDFESWMDDMTASTTLDAKTTSFFEHRDPEKAKWLGDRKLNSKHRFRLVGTRQLN